MKHKLLLLVLTAFVTGSVAYVTITPAEAAVSTCIREIEDPTLPN